jgi:hypothetical protein
MATSTGTSVTSTRRKRREGHGAVLSSHVARTRQARDLPPSAPEKLANPLREAKALLERTLRSSDGASGTRFRIDDTGPYEAVVVGFHAHDGLFLQCAKRIGKPTASVIEVVVAVEGLQRMSELEVTMRALGLTLPSELQAYLCAEDLGDALLAAHLKSSVASLLC